MIRRHHIYLIDFPVHSYVGLPEGDVLDTFVFATEGGSKRCIKLKFTKTTCHSIIHIHLVVKLIPISNLLVLQGLHPRENRQITWKLPELQAQQVLLIVLAKYTGVYNTSIIITIMFLKRIIYYRDECTRTSVWTFDFKEEYSADALLANAGVHVSLIRRMWPMALRTTTAEVVSM